MPLPVSDRRPLLPPAEWREAEARLAVALARAAMAVGRLDGVLQALADRDMRAGAIRRLAMIEVEAMLWARGTPIGPDEIGRDMQEALAGTDLPALQVARWAVRRLTGQGGLADMRQFLALHRTGRAAAPAPLIGRAAGPDFDAAAADFAARLDGLALAHPITRAAFGFALWRISDLSPDGEVVEPAAWAARLMGGDCAALPFVPMGHAGRRVWTQGGAVGRRLADWYDAVRAGADAAQGLVLRLADWRARATSRTAAIKGGSPARIIAALAAEPLLPASTIEARTGVSRDTVERLLSRMRQMELVREVTGGLRYRLWAARL